MAPLMAKMPRHLASTLISVVLLAAIGSSPVAARAGLPAFPADAFHPAHADGSNVPEVRGTWNIPGSGYLLDIGEKSMRAYSYAGNLCWADPALLVLLGDGNSIPNYAQTRRPVDMAFAADLYAGGTDQLHAERLGGVPPSCTSALDRTTPLYSFDALTQSLVDFYPFADPRHVNWLKRSARLRPRAAAARDDAALKAIFVDLLAGFEDAHTAIIGKVGEQGFVLGSEAKPTGHRLMERARRDNAPVFADWVLDWRKKQQDRVFAVLDPATRHKALRDDAVMWGIIDGNIGYLSIESMEGYAEDSDFPTDVVLMNQAIDRALVDLKGTRALILDITNNVGGSGQIGLEIASRFSDRQRQAFTLTTPGAYRLAPQPFLVVPNGHSRYLKPVYVLTSEVTVSAGEWLALGMRVLPNALQIGQATQGALTGDFIKGLPNGWILSTSNALIEDNHGIGYEVTGLPPDVPMDVYPTNPAVPDDIFDKGRVQAVIRTARLAATWRFVPRHTGI